MILEYLNQQFSQTYDDIVSINSLDTWKKVVIENGYEFANVDFDSEDWVKYGYGVTRDSTDAFTN